MTALSRTLNAFIFLLLLLRVSVAPGAAEDPKIAMQGYDAVAFFTVATPTKGKAEFSHVWDSERYLFSRAENRDLFAKEPERYAPQFPSLCAAALTRGEVVTPDPQNWVIIEGKLYLFGQAIEPQKFRDDPRLVEKAEANWMRMRKTAQ